MVVLNVAGYTVAFEANGRQVIIPFDMQHHQIPDECIDLIGGFCKVIVPPKVKSPEEIALEEKKKRLKQIELKKQKKLDEKKSRPLYGKKVTKRRGVKITDFKQKIEGFWTIKKKWKWDAEKLEKRRKEWEVQKQKRANGEI